MTRILRIPQHLEHDSAQESLHTPEATLVRYRALQRLSCVRVLVCQPTMVWVQHGIKHVQSHAEPHSVRVPSGSLLILRSGTHTMSEFHGDQNLYTSLVVSFHRSFLEPILRAYPQTQQKKTPSTVVLQPDRSTSNALARLYSLRSSETPEHQRDALQQCVRSVVDDPRAHAAMREDVAAWSASLEERIAAIAQKHCFAPLQVPDFAALCAMSVSSFKRHFRRVYGVSPGTWLSRSRLAQARTLATHGTMPISDLSSLCGYSDTSSFIRAFRRAYNTTPMALRRSAQELPA